MGGGVGPIVGYYGDHGDCEGGDGPEEPVPGSAPVRGAGKGRDGGRVSARPSRLPPPPS